MCAPATCGTATPPMPSATALTTAATLRHHRFFLCFSLIQSLHISERSNCVRLPLWSHQLANNSDTGMWGRIHLYPTQLLGSSKKFTWI